MADGDEDDFRDDLGEIDELRDEWRAVFGEPMPWGFEIGEGQIPMLHQCIAERSQELLRT